MPSLDDTLGQYIEMKTDTEDEIYEGDIISSGSTEDNSLELYIVEYYDEEVVLKRLKTFVLDGKK